MLSRPAVLNYAADSRTCFSSAATIEAMSIYDLVCEISGTE
jgi:hypothetical protein